MSRALIFKACEWASNVNRDSNGPWQVNVARKLGLYEPNATVVDVVDGGAAYRIAHPKSSQ